jgi:hypothetical protein
MYRLHLQGKISVSEETAWAGGEKQHHTQGKWITYRQAQNDKQRADEQKQHEKIQLEKYELDCFRQVDGVPCKGARII